MADVETPDHPGSVNELTVVGEFGFKRLGGPFTVQKDGTVWTVDIPEDYDHPSASTLPDDTERAAVLIADGETCGGGIVVEVLEDLEGVQYRVVIDQYAMGDPYEEIGEAEA